MRVCIAHVLRGITSKWNKGDATKAWKGTTTEADRKILKKYIGVFLKALKDEPFPEEDKKILRKFAKSFLKFLRSL